MPFLTPCIDGRVCILALRAQAVGKTHAYGVCHGSELPLVFHIDAILGLDAEKELSKQVVKWWETFAATGMPGATVAEW